MINIGNTHFPTPKFKQETLEWIHKHGDHATQIHTIIDANYWVSSLTFYKGWHDRTHFEEWFTEWASESIKDPEVKENPPCFHLGIMGTVDNDEYDPYQEVTSHITEIWKFDVSKSIAQNAIDAEKAVDKWGFEL